MAENLKSYILSGDITKGGRVKVRAVSKNDAIIKAELGDFEIEEEVNRGAVFEFDGGDEHIEEIIEENPDRPT